ncbi:MAG: AAA family ATPase [Clostridia bacterium]|nr:AAA family ATPase [Clostridia bacterium]
MKTSYFAPAEHRIYCFFGAVNDLYADEALAPISMDEMLHRDLKLRGYERIVFMGVTEGAWFLDERSRQLWHGKSAVQQTEAPRLRGALQGRLLGRQQTAAPAPQQAPRQNLFITLSAEEMVRYAGSLVRDGEVKTAVIIRDGLNMLDHLQHMGDNSLLKDLFLKVESIHDATNRNVLIFQFDRDERSVFDFMKADRWKYELGVLQERAVRHRIPAVGEKEVQYALHYLRLKGLDGKKLRLELKEVEAMGEMISRKMLRNISESEDKGALQSGSIELKARSLLEMMRHILDWYMEKGEVLDIESCRNMCGHREEKDALRQLDELIGMQVLKDVMRQYIKLNGLKKGKKIQPAQRLEPPAKDDKAKSLDLNFVITGRPGTGKTTAVRILGRIMAEYGLLPSGHVVETRPSELIGQHVGDSEANMRKAVQRAMGGVLFIDEAYGFASDDNHGNSYKEGMVDELVASMTAYKGEFAVVLAGYQDKIAHMLATMNPGLKERFSNHVHLEDYSPEELADIFRLMAKGKNLSVSQELDERLVLFMDNWYHDCQNDWANGRSVANLLGEMEKNGAAESKCLTLSQIPADKVVYTSGEQQENTRKMLDEMIGLGGVKQQIDDFENMLIFGGGEKRKNHHFVFSGNPGTGKTTIARIFGQLLKGAGILKSGRVREVKAETLLKDPGALAAEISKSRDCVLFIDEAYQLLKAPHVIDQLVEKTEPSQIDFPFTMICAGYKKDMQSFMKYNDGMPRRFKVIQFDRYSAEELMQILKQELPRRCPDYAVTEEFLQGTLAHFQRHIDVIGQKYNAGYIGIYLEDGVKALLFRRLRKEHSEKTLKELMALPKSEYRLTMAEVPENLVNQE